MADVVLPDWLVFRPRLFRAAASTSRGTGPNLTKSARVAGSFKTTVIYTPSV
jgi:hypothetical protein